MSEIDNIQILTIELKAISACIDEYTDEPNVTTWRESMLHALDDGDYDVLVYSCRRLLKWYGDAQKEILSNEYVFNKKAHKDNFKRLGELTDELNKNPEKYKALIGRKEIPVNNQYGVQALLRLLDRFHQVVIQLRDRHDDRETIDVVDEYDVQDLLHALLRVFYDDVRAEEWTPSYAGSSKRQDFLLKSQKIVIEVKKTRKGLGNKELGDQLLIDIGSYKSHPDCKTLICFVYDVENRVKNPRGFENDLSKMTDGVDVHVIVRP